MRRPPIVATLVVLAAIATMIGLGMWQLRRAAWKEALLARYSAAQGQPVLVGLGDTALDDPESVAFRRVTLACVPQDGAIQIGGRNRAGAIGYRTIAPCVLPRGGTMMVDLGWSAPGRAPPRLANPRAIGFTGRLIPDPPLAARALAGHTHPIALLLVADTPAPTLQPSVPPSIEDIPNNHRAYAVQWFLFAAVAFTVYLLALRRRGG